MRPFTFTFYLSLLVHLSIWAQPLDACYPEVSFTGNAAQTLCEQYGSILPDHTIGVTGSVKASDIGEELSGNILIAGDFYIDRPFLFYDAIIRIVPGAAIKLSAPPAAPGGEGGGGGLSTLPFLSKLTIDNSKLFACNDLWEGIIVYPRSAIFLRNHTVIEDAETVVRAHNASDAVIDFIHTTLNRNRIGIELASSLSPPPVLANFYGVNFTCTAPLNGTVDEVGFAGIRTDRTSFSIGGVPGFPNNVFKGMEYGIYSGGDNVTISLRGAYFEDLKRSGIFMTHGSLYTDHVGMMDCGPRMLEIRRVVNCTMGNTRFTFADSVEIPVGSSWHLVYLHGFMPSAILNISESKFVNISGSALRRIGLRFDGTDMGDETKVSIFDNEFDGIGIQYFGSSSKHVTIHIENNDFDSGDALSINGGDKYNVKIIGNDFSNSAGSTLGSSVLGVENEFSDNDLNSTSHVRIQGFTNGKYCSNEFKGSRLIADGMSPGTELLNNSFQFVDPQIRVLQNSVISEQVNGGNRFLTSLIIPTPTVVCETYSLSFASKFSINEPQSEWDDQLDQYTIFSEYHPYMVLPDEGLYEDAFFQYDTELDPPNSLCITRATHPDTLDRAIATGTLDTLLSKANRWILQLYLYDLLERRDSLKQAYSYLQDFLLTYADSSVGMYYTIHSSLLDAFSVDSANRHYLTILQSSRDTLVLNGAKADSMILMATDSAGYWMAMENKSANLASLHALDSLIHDLDAVWLTTRDSALAGIRGLIRTLPLDVDFIPDLQFSLEYLIDRLLDPGSISAGRTDSLLTIASRCPDEAGIAQYFAYGLIGPCEDPAQYDPEINCAFSSAMNSPFVPDMLTPVPGKINDVIREALDTNNNGSIDVYPNPTQGELYVVWPEKKDVSLKIISSEGKLVYAAKVTGDLNGYHIPLALYAGIYVIIAADNLGQSAMSKIVVVR